MALAMETRTVGKVAVMRCNGRIASGDAVESLRVQVSGMFGNHKHFILHLGDVDFIDSSGLGTLVRLLSSTRRLRGDLKLCNVRPNIDKVLRMTNLHTLLETHPSEESAIAAFYQKSKSSEPETHTGHSVVCVDKSGDVLAYVRELLRRGGYDAHTTSSLSDSVILARVLRPIAILVGPSHAGSTAAKQTFAGACSSVPIIDLGNDFATLDAGDAATRLLESMQKLLTGTRGGVAN
jgi:anti-sigma B factor antagonist